MDPLGYRLGSFFDRLGGRFGLLGGSFWALRGVSERLGVVLGAVDGHKCRASNFAPRLVRFFTPSWHPKREPKRPQDDQKSIQKVSLKNDRPLDRS